MMQEPSIIIPNLPSLWQEEFIIDARLQNTACPLHKNEGGICQFQMNLDRGKIAIIHYPTHNKMGLNYEIHCQRIPSRKYYILNVDSRFRLGIGDYIHVAEDKIFCTGKICHHFVPFQTLLSLNNKIFNKHDNTISSWKTGFRSEYKSKLQAKLRIFIEKIPNKQQCISPDNLVITNFIETQVPRHADLDAIYWFLFEKVWLPAKEDLRVAVRKIPTSFVAYDLTFDLGANIYDTVSGKGPKKYPDLFIGQQINEEKTVFENKEDNNNTANDDCKMINLDENEEITMEIDEFEYKYSNKKKKYRLPNITLMTKKKASEMILSWMITGSDREFVYDIDPVPGKGENHCYLLPVLRNLFEDLLYYCTLLRYTFLVFKCDGIFKNRHIYKEIICDLEQKYADEYGQIWNITKEFCYNLQEWGENGCCHLYVLYNIFFWQISAKF